MDAYEQFKALWIELDRLCAAGTGDSPEADTLRDRMDPPWNAMRDDERARFSDESETLARDPINML